MTKKSAIDLPVLAFESKKRWEAWLAKNHAKSPGIWLRFFKKDSGVETVSHAEALDAALCYGWIDGQLAKHDERSWLRKFTPRRPKSIWSKRNIQHVKRLMEEGKMKPAGLEEVERAKSDGRWGKAYDSPSKMVVPEDFLEMLSKNKRARSFFETLNKANRYSIAWRFQTAKEPETRDKRMKAIIEMLAKGEKFH
ncbi:MAG TPA: YdeI/OmpD-associated family protein [Gemmatimonadota bacterium]|nr:YdeI/OmpD-associated family protein [Gemmatimonadota bacterium]